MNKNLHVDLTEEMGQISSESPAVIHVSADLYNFFSSHVRRRQKLFDNEEHVHMFNEDNSVWAQTAV